MKKKHVDLRFLYLFIPMMSVYSNDVAGNDFSYYPVQQN